MATILLVDDQPQNIELLEAYLVPQGYEIIKAANGEEALGKLAFNRIDLMLLDVMMPGMDGFEVTRRVRLDEKNRLLPVILVTALHEKEDRVNGIEAGCDDFISKPVDKMELLARVRALLKVKAYNDLLANYRKELEFNVTEKIGELKQAFTAITKVISGIIEMRDVYTARHQLQVAHLARNITLEMGLSESRADQIYTAGLIHDIGKINTPIEILCKPGGLSEIEFSLIKMHPQAGFDVLKDIDFPYPLARWVLEHHERMNGSGYPNSLIGDRISLEARVIAVADVVDAMSSNRPYRPAIGIDKAYEEINMNKDILYDGKVVDSCLRLLNKKSLNLEKISNA